MKVYQVGPTDERGKALGPFTWNQVLGIGPGDGLAKPGDHVQLMPGDWSYQDYKVWTPGLPGEPIEITPMDKGVKFDGRYTWPVGRTANTGPGGDVTWEPLIQVNASHVHLLMDTAELVRSRGAGVGEPGGEKTPLKDVKVNGFFMKGLRAGAIRFDWCDGFEAAYNIVSDAGNYYPAFRDGKLGAWPMIINCVASSNGDMHHNLVTDGWGELGPNVSRGSFKVKVHHNVTAHGMGAHYYLHGCQDVDCYANVGLEFDHFLRGAGPGYIFVVNPGEPQYIGQQVLYCSRVRLSNNLAGGGMQNFALWAEGGETCEDVAYIHNTSIKAGRGKRNDKWHDAFVIRGSKNVKGLVIASNAVYQPDGRHGFIDKDILNPAVDDNVFDKKPSDLRLSSGGRFDLQLTDPEVAFSLPFNLESFRPVGAGGGAQLDHGLLEDISGRSRKHRSVGALEPAADPVVSPPVTDPLRIRLAGEHAARMRTALDELKTLLTEAKFE